MSSSQLENNINALIEAPLADMGYDIVRIKFSDGDSKVLQIMAERQSDKQLNIDDCSKISHYLSDLFDVEDIIAGEYNLEVSSPGIDRPLVRKSDFNEYKNNLFKATTKQPIDGRRRYKGMLLGLSEDENNVLLKLNDTNEEISLPFNEIESAKLIFTDELVNKNKK